MLRTSTGLNTLKPLSKALRLLGYSLIVSLSATLTLNAASATEVAETSANQPANWSIDKVIFHEQTKNSRSGATVLRTLSAPLKKGTQEFIVYGIPASFASTDILAVTQGDTSYAFEVKDTAYRTQKDPTQASQADILKQINTLKDDLKAAQRHRDTVAAQMNFVRNITTDSSSPKDWDTALEFIEKKTAALALIETQASNDIEALEDEIKRLKDISDSYGSGTRDVLDVLISLQSPLEEKTTLTLHTFTPDAYWVSSVRANLVTNTKDGKATVKMSSVAEISQNSGEDWNVNKIELGPALSSANTPDLDVEPNWVSLYTPGVVQLRRAETTSYRSQSKSDAFEEVAVTAGLRSKTYNDDGTQLSYSITGSTISRSGGAPVTITLEEHIVDAVITNTLFPDRAEQATLVATLKAPYTTANAQTAYLTRNNFYLGKTQWPQFAEGQDIDLAFGTVNSIKLDVADVAGNNSTSGAQVNDFKKRYTVTNTSSLPATVDVKVPAYISNDREAIVSQLAGHTPTTKTEKDGGVFVWHKTLAPGEAWEINNFTRINFPEERRLQISY